MCVRQILHLFSDFYIFHFPCFTPFGNYVTGRNQLDNVHSDPDGDFSEVERIRQTGALIIGTYDRLSYGDPRAFIEQINSHTQHPDETR